MSSPPKVRDPRNGLRTSATLATVFTLLGHTLFGFEQAPIHVLTALCTGYACSLLFETLDARVNGRVPGFLGGGWKKVVDWMLSTHMTSITTSFLLYTNEHRWALAFSVAAAIGSKYIFRVRSNGRYIHFLNPSNFGICLSLTLFPWVIIIPYHFTSHLHGAADVVVPLIIVALGTRLNVLFTKRIPMILTWLGCFAAQALLRALVFGTPLLAGLSIMTGLAFILFTLYMITDPQTSPSSLRGQIAFGASIAASYAVLMMNHVDFALFYAVFVVTVLRGVYLFVDERSRVARASQQPAGVAVSA